jgi:3-deoxy-manno-octulosonate cytidylyltransferase (CMP-KDO synthetase)
MHLRIIIPARYGSTRFPGKPLAPIAGVPLLQRVWAIGASVVGKDNAIVTTDDKRIAEFSAQIGATVIMTDPAISNGTERVHAALQQLPAEIDQIINLQGDAVLTPPWVIRAVIEEMSSNARENHPPLAGGSKSPCYFGGGSELLRNSVDVDIFTPAVRMNNESLKTLRAAKAAGEAGGTTVTFDKNNNALYFSKSIIPHIRQDGSAGAHPGADAVPPVHRHIGLYGYRRAALNEWVALKPGPLEQTEKLEQLRALENGLKIRVVIVDYKSRSHIGIDSEADARRAEALIAQEGELLPSYDGNYSFSP